MFIDFFGRIHTHTDTHTHVVHAEIKTQAFTCFCTHINTKPKFGFLKIDFVKEAINICLFSWFDGPVALGLLVVEVSISPSSKQITLSRIPLDE